MNSFKNKYRLSSVILTVFVVAAVILLNVVVTVISNRTPLKYDLTRERVYEFSNQTNEIIKNIDERVNVYALYPQDNTNDYIEYAREYLSKYSGLNKNIKVTYVDPYENPTFAKKYENLGEPINPGSIIVECGEKVKVVTLEQLYSQNQYTGATSIDMEKKMTMAFSFVTGQSGDSKILFTTGHSEQESLSLRPMLEEDGYITEDVNIALNNISDDADLLVVMAPSVDFTAEEINILDEYMDKGGKMLYISTPGKYSLEKLESYMKEWGIIPNQDIVVETNQNFSYGSELVPVATLCDHEITKNLKAAELLFVAPYSGSVTLTNSNIRYALTYPLLETSDKSYGKKDTESTSTQKEEGDVDGPLTLSGLAVMQGETKGMIGFITSLHSVELDIVKEASFANGDFILNMVSYMTEKTNPLNIRAKEISSTTLAINDTQIIICYIVLQYLIPIVIIGIGLYVWFRRRYL